MPTTKQPQSGQWVAIYCRISRDGKEGSGLGVKRQEEDCRALVERHWPSNSIHTYVDNDLSAYSTRQVRKQYQNMLDDVRAGLVNAIVAWHPDRLHRQPRELEDFIDLVETSGAEIATVGTGAYDLSTPSGRLIARQLGSLARYESEHRAERQARKHLELATAGKPSGPAFYGYRNGNGTFVIERSEAKVIREIAQRLLKGESMNSIANDLNERGIPTARGRKWNTTTIRKTITKPSIAGLRVHNGEQYKAQWKPIIDRETWDRVTALLSQQTSTVIAKDGTERQRHRMRAQPRRYLLTSGLARCGLCGAALTAQARQPWRDGKERQPIYVCPAKSNGGCGGIAILAPDLEKLVTRKVLNALIDEHIARALKQRKKRRPSQAEIDSLQAKLNELSSWYADGQITGGEYMTARKPIEAKLRAAQRTAVADIDIASEPKTILREWKIYSIPQKQAVIKLLFEKIEVGKAIPGRKTFDPDRVHFQPSAILDLNGPQRSTRTSAGMERDRRLHALSSERPSSRSASQ